MQLLGLLSLIVIKLALPLHVRSECFFAVLLLDLLSQLLLGEGLGFDLAHALVRKSFHLVFTILNLLQVLSSLLGVGRNSCVHLGEEQAQHTLPVLPLEVVEVHLVGEWLLTSVG